MSLVMKGAVLLGLLLTIHLIGASSVHAAEYEAGTATVDVTPAGPIRLSGYLARKEETSEVETRLYVKALALRHAGGAPFVLVTVDNCAISLPLADEAAARIEQARGVPRERVAINLSHTHSAPVLTGVIPNIFGMPVPLDQQDRIDAYTRLIVGAIADAAVQALDALQPATLHLGTGTAGFAKNRRTPGGPVDHDLPVLFVKGAGGAVRAVVANYACHCTVLSANKVNGDWAGYAQQYLQEAFPGATGMVTIGCGADQNPMPRGHLEQAMAYGRAIADGARTVLDAGTRELRGPIEAVLRRPLLAFDTLPAREEWEARAKEDSPKGFHARMQMLKLSRGEGIRAELPYTVQRVSFGEDLAMLFLAGEVVVDYATRFKTEYDRKRLWVSGYSNDVPCYIPSARILAEGGYEGADAMIYYDQPTKFAADVEDRIAAAVHEIVPEAFQDKHEKTGGFPPLRPHDALGAFVLPEGYEAQLVACEPQIVDPVALDFAPDGAIFVAEMNDYNIAPEQNNPARGRIKRLTDTNGDGFYDEARIYLDDLPYPTGVTVWRNGILVCAAPDLIYAEDTDGDGAADTRRVLFTGFAKNNYQARLNSLSWGLDNWMYGGGGLLGGRVTRGDGTGEAILLGARDFRFNPDTLAFETATGNSQYGRARDDWDNWFGCDSSNLLKFYALPEHLLAKAPNVVPPPASVTIAGAPYDVYPVSSHVERFNDPGDLNRVTSACGLAIYRDELLGEGFRGNAFNCEPVHNLVTRLVVEPQGALFTARRAEGEEQREFVASRDHWFRPAQVRTGPDGALWVVDMYRYVVEHEKWITPDRREALDMQAGADRGRIYRIKRKDTPLRPVEDLTKLDTAGLVAALENPNGTVRDLVHQMLLWKQDPAAVEPLKELARQPTLPEFARAHAICVLDGLGALDEETLLVCGYANHYTPEETGLLAQAARLIGPRGRDSDRLWRAIADLSGREGRVAIAALPWLGGDKEDKLHIQRIKDAIVRYGGGLWVTTRISPDLPEREAQKLRPEEREREILLPGDPYIIAAALVAASGSTEEVARLLSYSHAALAPLAFPGLARLAAAEGSVPALHYLIHKASTKLDPVLVEAVLEAGAAHGYSRDDLVGDWNRGPFESVLDHARKAALDVESASPERAAGLALLARVSWMTDFDQALFGAAIGPESPQEVRRTVVDALAKRDDPATARFLVAKLPGLEPALRGTALDALLRREAWCALLLDHLEAAPVAGAQLDAARKQFLLRHPDDVLRVRAEALLGGANTARAEVLARYAETERIAGDPARGALLFEERCGQCHALDGKGHALGPDLSALTDKSAPALLKAILDPNETVLEQYQAFSVETKDLRTLDGIVGEETANSITIKMAGGLQETVLRSDIDRIGNSGLSLMPEGLEENLSPAQMADVLAFVQTRAPAAKTFAGNAPARVAPDAQGHLTLTAENAAIFGGPGIEYRPRFGAIGGWAGPADRAEWALEVAEAGDYAVEMTWTAPPGAEGTPWRITCGGAVLEGVLASTGGMENFVLREIGRVRLAAGPQTFIFAPAAPVKYGWMELRAITLKRLQP